AQPPASVSIGRNSTASTMRRRLPGRASPPRTRESLAIMATVFSICRIRPYHAACRPGAGDPAGTGPISRHPYHRLSTKSPRRRQERRGCRTDAPMETIEVHQYRSLANGPRLLVLGAVHGNETCGPTAIRSVAAQFATGERRLARGVLTLVPVANPVAFKRGTREGDRNLNRDFRPSVCPENAEDRIANHLAPILRDHDALLDLHSFAAEGSPFVF